MRSKESIEAMIADKRAQFDSAGNIERCLLAGWIHALEWALEEDE